MSEYYIKQPDTDHARGPLSLEQIVSLADTGTVTEATLLYDEITEKWKPITAFEDLYPTIFPQKVTLSLDRSGEIDKKTQKEDEKRTLGIKKKELSTETLLADATGDTKATRHVGNRRKSREKAAELALPGISTVLLIGAFGLIYPCHELLINAFETKNFAQLASNPMLILGLIMVVFTAVTFMKVTEIFPFVRILGAVTCGTLGYIYWAWNSIELMICGIALGLGLFGATISIRYFWMLISLTMGILGGIAISYFAFTGEITYPL